MNLFEKKIDGEIVFDGKIFKVEVDEVELPDGAKTRRECVRHHGGAAIFCITQDGKLLLVKQFRYLYGKEIYEIPAGKLEEDEDPLSAAVRELKEETGYVPERISPFLKIYPTPGYTDEVIHIFKAENCRQGESCPDAGEFLKVRPLAFDAVLKMIDSGEICDAKTVAAVYKYLSEKK